MEKEQNKLIWLQVVTWIQADLSDFNILMSLMNLSCSEIHIMNSKPAFLNARTHKRKGTWI